MDINDLEVNDVFLTKDDPMYGKPRNVTFSKSTTLSVQGVHGMSEVTMPSGTYYIEGLVTKKE